MTCSFQVLGWLFTLALFVISGAKAIEILEAYEGTLEDDYPPENERCEHWEMLLYKVIALTCSAYICTSHSDYAWEFF